MPNSFELKKSLITFNFDDSIKSFKKDEIGLNDLKSRIRMLLQNSIYEYKSKLDDLESNKAYILKKNVKKWSNKNEEDYLILKGHYEKPILEYKDLVTKLEQVSDKKSLNSFLKTLKG